jgi:hypothetical protein
MEPRTATILVSTPKNVMINKTFQHSAQIGQTHLLDPYRAW